MLNAIRDVLADLEMIATAGNELITDHATFKAVVDDIKSLVNDIRSKLKGDHVVTCPDLKIGADTTAVKCEAFTYMINGVLYYKASTETEPGNDVVPQNKYGAVAFDIGADGTIDVVEAPANAAGYDSAALAAAALPAVAADHARMGYVTAMKDNGAFTFGTTDLNDANTTEAYTNGTSAMTAIGAAVATSTPAALSAHAMALRTHQG